MCVLHKSLEKYNRQYEEQYSVTVNIYILRLNKIGKPF